MAEGLSPADGPERPNLLRRRSRNPIKNMMQHLSVDDPQEEGSPNRRDSLIRRLSRRASRSRSSTRSDGSASVTGSAAQDPALCKSCASWATDIEAIFREAEDTVLGQHAPGGSADAFDKKEHAAIMLKGLEEDRWSTTCPLCKLLWAVHVPSQGDGDYCLSGFSSRDTNYLLDKARLFDSDHPAKRQDRAHAPAFLGVVPRKTGDGALGWDVKADWFRKTGMLYRALPEPELPRTPSGNSDKLTWKRPAPDFAEMAEFGIWGRELEQEIDMNIAADWLQYCKSHHHERCARQPVLSEMEGFQLIDCLRSPPQVVDASIKEDFVALSYVWGDNTTEAWPRVFRDAVAVTQELGLRYLWVDKICLSGAQPQIRMRQISRMNEIYEGAAVTIIAAYGKDATYGLPGVGSTSRPEQPKYTFVNNNITLVSSLPDPRLSVKESAWYTRGWTYQEGFVARRRLIFTEHQMYWECEGMVCPESLVLPLDFYHDAKEQRMCDFMRPGLFNGVSFVDNSWQSWKRLPRQHGGEEPSTLGLFREVDQHIVDYTRRKLTLDEDSLSAFLGITRQLETLARGRLINLVGIPVWQAAEEPHSRGPARTRDLFALSTSFWHHKDGEAARRRRHLPSWTWAGWKGAVEMFSSISVADAGGKTKGRKFFNHHYVTATQLTRNEPNSLKWTYSPEMVLLSPDGSVAWDFRSNRRQPSAPRLPPQRYAIRVSDPLVLDKVKARTHSGGWMFNHLSVDVRLSNATSGAAPPSIRTYVERHAAGEQMTVLWFVEETTVLLLVVERTVRGDTWERVGRMRMGFADGAREVMQRCGDLEGLLQELPLRRLGEDIILE